MASVRISRWRRHEKTGALGERTLPVVLLCYNAVVACTSANPSTLLHIFYSKPGALGLPPNDADRIGLFLGSRYSGV
ncbi:hypothetical protein JB92DRAFT_2912366 [Gautieria morchelliformis]|nr:hypothetical protein JB92DRAFT_2912366 [Gautieria morchelliformis]